MDDLDFSFSSVINAMDNDIKKCRWFGDMIVSCSFDNNIMLFVEDEEEEDEFYMK